MTVENAPENVTQEPAQAAEKPVVAASALPPDALKARIDQAREQGAKSILESLGLKSTDELRALVDERQKAIEASKTEAERLAAKAVELERTQLQLSVHKQANDIAWERESARLTPEQKDAVDKIAGDDVALRLKALSALAPTWAKPEAAPTAPPVVSTAPAANAPKQNATQGDESPKAVYESLRRTNPIAAANYAARHKFSFLAE